MGQLFHLILYNIVQLSYLDFKEGRLTRVVETRLLIEPQSLIGKIVEDGYEKLST